MDANIRRPLPGPVARLALKSESLQEVAQFEAVAQNLRNHVQGAFGSTAAIWGRPGERRVLALTGGAGCCEAVQLLKVDRLCSVVDGIVDFDPIRMLRYGIGAGVLALAVALIETTAPQAEFFAWVFAVRSGVSP